MKKKIINQIVTMLTASFAFVAALAWNDAVQGLLNKLVYFQDKRIEASFIYAILVTIIAVLISTLFAKWLKDEENH